MTPFELFLALAFLVLAFFLDINIKRIRIMRYEIEALTEYNNLLVKEIKAKNELIYLLKNPQVQNENQL